MSVAAEDGPQLGEDFLARGLGFDVVARGDVVDDVEPVFEVGEDEQEGLGFEHKALDFFFDDASVLDVLIEERVLCEFQWLKGR